MTGSGEKHAQDKNLIWCILVALRPILLLTVYINTLYLCVKALAGAFSKHSVVVTVNCIDVKTEEP